MLQYRKTRIIFVTISFIAFLLLIRSNFSPSNSGKISLPRKFVIASTVFSKSEFLSEIAQTDKCPVCFGQDMCEELSRKDMEISRELFSADKRLPGIHQVFQGKNLKYWLKPLSSWTLNQHAMVGFESFVCRNGSLTRGPVNNCSLPDAAARSFLYTSAVDTPTLLSLHQAHLISRRRLPLTSCPTRRLAESLVQAFDLDGDRSLMAREKAQLLTSVAAWPDVAVSRFLVAQGVRFPRVSFYGTCGRVQVVEGAFKPLASYLDQSLEVRKGLAIQLMQLIETLINEDPNWFLFTTDITMDNLVVTNAGQVAFLDLSQMMILDREVMDAEDDAKEVKVDECDFKCLENFYEKLLDSKDTKSCFKVKEHVEYMFALACRNVLSDMEMDRALRTDDQRGLLHSVHNEDETVEVNNLLRECVDETDKGGRLSAAMNLLELFAAKFNDGEHEDNEGANENGEDYEEGNVPHQKSFDDNKFGESMNGKVIGKMNFDNKKLDDKKLADKLLEHENNGGEMKADLTNTADGNAHDDNNGGEVSDNETAVRNLPVSVKKKKTKTITWKHGVIGDSEIAYDVKYEALLEKVKKDKKEEEDNLDKDFDEGDDERVLPPPPGVKLESPVPLA